VNGDLKNQIRNSSPFELREDISFSKHVLLGKNAVYLTIALVAPWTLLLIYLEEYVCAALVLGFLPASFTALLLFRVGSDRLARMTWLLTSTTLVTLISMFYAGQTAHEVTFFILMGFPFLIFAVKQERQQLLICLVYILASALLAFLDAAYGLGEAIGIQQRQPTDSAPHIQFAIFLTVSALIVSQLAYLAYHLNVSGDEVRAALVEAQSAYRARNKFMANMSHEIRTPMNGIIGTLDVLEHSGIKPNQQRSMSTIRESAMSLLRIIDDVLDASKIDADKLDIVSTKTEIADLVEQVAQTLIPLSSSHGVAIRLFLDPKIPDYIEIDAVRLRQILLNILSNAVKYSASSLTKRPGDVVIFATVDGENTLTFKISDNGIGMDEDLVATFCDPYVQGRETLFSSIRGTGLGMAITTRLVSLMQGSFSAESDAGKGTTITISLPLVPVATPSLLPDLSGLTVYFIGPSVPALEEGLDIVVGHAGATWHLTEDLDDLPDLPADPTERPIFLLLPTTPAEFDRIEEEIRQKHPHAGVIRCTTDRSVLIRRLSSGTFIFPVMPMIRNDFYSAIAELAGREVPRPPWQQEELPRAPNERRADFKSRNILVVDDNAINLHVLQSQLKLLGHHAVTASNGREALLQWRAGEFDLLITDVQMPEMSGFALARAIRLQEKECSRPAMPILAVTANIETENEDQFKQSGMNSWMLKPIKYDDLQEAIERIDFPKS
jgi:signal transduction histidine kinase/ActR/RegA family two-component response regulator